MTSAIPPCDTRAFVEQLGGDHELASQMARTFLGQIDRQMAAVRAALSAGDGEALRRSAHALKGASANFLAAPTVAIAAELERAGREHDLAGAGTTVARLDSEVARLVAALREFGQPGPCAS